MCLMTWRALSISSRNRELKMFDDVASSVHQSLENGSLEILHQKAIQCGDDRVLSAFELEVCPFCDPSDGSCTEGRAVKVVPMKRIVRALGYMLLKLRYDGPPSNFTFKFDLRRYTKQHG
jgi:hypothetical protein